MKSNIRIEPMCEDSIEFCRKMDELHEEMGKPTRVVSRKKI